VGLITAALRIITGDALEGARTETRDQGTQTDPEDMGTQGKTGKKVDTDKWRDHPDRYKSGWHERYGRRVWDGSDWEDD
jgi:hypothetical protein